MTAPSTLEVLYAARRRLSDPKERFVYGDWTRCTCGHIYAAAVGRRGGIADVFPAYAGPRARIQAAYARIILDVAAALGWDGDTVRGLDPGDSVDAAAYATAHVSGSTMGDDGDASRADAVRVIDRAIAAIEAEDAVAMKTVATATVLTTPHDQELDA